MNITTMILPTKILITLPPNPLLTFCFLLTFFCFLRTTLIADKQRHLALIFRQARLAKIPPTHTHPHPHQQAYSQRTNKCVWSACRKRDGKIEWEERVQNSGAARAVSACKLRKLSECQTVRLTIGK